MNIVLIGYRGTGKSAVGRNLAARTGRQLVSTDDELVRRAGCSIPDFVAAHGWDQFRELEATVIQDTAAEADRVIDTGGGVILREDNIVALRRSGRVFWLKAQPATIRERIEDDSGRPSLTGTKSFLDEVEEILKSRTPLYSMAADHAIDTENHTVDEIAERILNLFDRDDRGG